jgi:NitT/TauT family transport system ATP-binding protein
MGWNDIPLYGIYARQAGPSRRLADAGEAATLSATREAPPIIQAAPAGDTVIKATALNHAYQSAAGWTVALQDLDLEINRDDFFCVLGPSGCGKSSFLRMLAGLMFPLEGSLLVNGKPITGPGPDRAVVFQEAALFPWLTAARNVAFGLEMAAWPKAAVARRVAHVLDIVGLSDAADRYPHQLSGGMRHRVAIARAWAIENASVLLMDEPFSAIDAINRTALQNHLVETWIAEPRTVVYVTHDIEEAIFLADRIAILTPSPGRVAAELRIDLERPRDRAGPEMIAMKQRITALMQGAGEH